MQVYAEGGAWGMSRGHPLLISRGHTMGGGGNPRRSNGFRRDKLRARVLGRGDPCWVCGLPIDRSLPNLHPCQGVVDEVVPVSQGGSPFDLSNCRAAHRCCNSWRSTKPVAVVRVVQSAVSEMGGAATPQQWCSKAREVMAALRRGSSLAVQEQVEQSTDW